MSHNNQDNLSDGDLQQLLLHAAKAETAGVFRQTPVDTALIMAETRGRRGWLGITLIATPIAACMALWFGLVELNPGAPIANVPISAVISNTEAGGSDCVSLAVLNSCLTGPGATSLPGDCACADLDSDGDVDFADFGRFQQTVDPLRG